MELAKQLSQIEEIDNIRKIKAEIDQLRPFSKELEQRILQKFRLEWTYHSNAIEGNPYNYGETVTFLLYGITAKGKKLKDHLDIEGHHEGINYILNLVKDKRGFTESDIRDLHKIILVKPYSVNAITPTGQKATKQVSIGKYKTEPNHVKTETGEMHYYATPDDTPILMRELMDWFKEIQLQEDIHPIVTAALFHHKFVSIHPFDDGNGRLGRILMNFILIKYNYPPIIVKNNDRFNYYSVLSQADSGDYFPLVEYMTNELLESLSIQQKGLKGEEIFELSDVDKRISIFKKSLENKPSNNSKKDFNTIHSVLKNSYFPLF